MKNSQAEKANKVRRKLAELNPSFARIVVAHYISGLTEEHRLEMISLIKNIQKMPTNLVVFTPNDAA